MDALKITRLHECIRAVLRRRMDFNLDDRNEREVIVDEMAAAVIMEIECPPDDPKDIP